MKCYIYWPCPFCWAPAACSILTTLMWPTSDAQWRAVIPSWRRRRKDKRNRFIVTSQNKQIISPLVVLAWSDQWSSLLGLVLGLILAIQWPICTIGSRHTAGSQFRGIAIEKCMGARTAWYKASCKFVIETIDGKHTLCGCSVVHYLEYEHCMNQSWDTRWLRWAKSCEKRGR